MKQSNFLSLNWRDISRSLLVTILSALYYFAIEVFIPGLDISPETKAMISTVLGYLSKNFITKPDSGK